VLFRSGDADADAGGDVEADAGAQADAEAELLLRLSIPGRPQFYTDYRAGSGEELVDEEAAGEEQVEVD